MKSLYERLRAGKVITVFLTRDSVCAGDDGDAPHEKRVVVPQHNDPEALARAISEDYLPSVDGVGHSWTCVLNGVHIARITTRGIEALVTESVLSGNNRAHFIYHSATF